MNNYRYHGSWKSNTCREGNTEKKHEPIYKPDTKKEKQRG